MSDNGSESRSAQRQTRSTDDPLSRRRRQRRSGLLNHFLAYFCVLVVMVPVNFLVTPDVPWFLAIMVGWGAPLAIHVAVVMEIFGPPKV